MTERPRDRDQVVMTRGARRASRNRRAVRVEPGPGKKRFLRPPLSLTTSTARGRGTRSVHQRRDVVQHRDVAHQPNGRRTMGDAEEGRDDAVDPVGSSIGEGRAHARLAPPLDVAHRHRRTHDQRRRVLVGRRRPRLAPPAPRRDPHPRAHQGDGPACHWPRAIERRSSRHPRATTSPRRDNHSTCASDHRVGVGHGPGANRAQ